MPYLSKEHLFEVRFNPQSKKVNENFNIVGVYFSPLTGKRKTKSLSSSSKHYKIEVLEPAPKGSGIKLFITPSLKNIQFIDNSYVEVVNITSGQVIINSQGSRDEEEE